MEATIAGLDHTDPDFRQTYMRVLSFIHQTVEDDVLKEEFVKLAQTMGQGDVAKSIPTNRIGIEGKIAYCVNRGAKLAPTSMERVTALLGSNAAAADDSTGLGWEYLPETPASKAARAYINCYSMIDNAKTQVLRGTLDQRELAGEVRKIVNQRAGGKPATVKLLADHYKDSVVEAKRDESIKDWVKPLSIIAETLWLLMGNRAAIKAGAKGAKARKMSSTLATHDRKGEKAAAKVTYKDEDLNLGIISIDPTNLVGADAAVVFNTKNRHCEVYYAKPGSKLSVKGASIVNFDETTSGAKTVRKPENELPHWTRATTLKRLEVLFKGINGKSWEVTGKLNRNCMIVKVL